MTVRNGERGQAVTELAVLFFVMIAALLGIMDWSWTMFAHESLVSRASMAARWGAVHIYSGTNISATKDLVLYGQTPCSGCTAFMGLTTGNVSVSRTATTYTPEDNGVSITTCQLAVTISGYTIQHFTPGFASGFVTRPVTATYVFENPTGSDGTCTAP